jgi:hypothetical protein
MLLFRNPRRRFGMVRSFSFVPIGKAPRTKEIFFAGKNFRVEERQFGEAVSYPQKAVVFPIFIHNSPPQFHCIPLFQNSSKKEKILKIKLKLAKTNKIFTPLFYKPKRY